MPPQFIAQDVSVYLRPAPISTFYPAPECCRSLDVPQGEGDTVVATALPDRPGHVEIASIQGDGGRLTLEASKNCVGIAAIETLKLLGQPSCGVSLRLQKVRSCSIP